MRVWIFWLWFLWWLNEWISPWVHANVDLCTFFLVCAHIRTDRDLLTLIYFYGSHRFISLLLLSGFFIEYDVLWAFEVLFRIVVEIRIAWSDAEKKKSNIFFFLVGCCNFILASMTHNAFTAAVFIDYTEKKGLNKISMEQCRSEQKKQKKKKQEKTFRIVQLER